MGEKWHIMHGSAELAACSIDTIQIDLDVAILILLKVVLKSTSVIGSDTVLNIAVNLSCRILVTDIILSFSLWYF